MNKTIYFAVNRDGTEVFFVSLPYREERLGKWLGNIIPYISRTILVMVEEGFHLPEITWKNDPVALKLELSISNE